MYASAKNSSRISKGRAGQRGGQKWRISEEMKSSRTKGGEGEKNK